MMRCWTSSVLARFQTLIECCRSHEVQDRLFAQVWKNHISVHTSTDRCALDLHDMNMKNVDHSQDTFDARQENSRTAIE
jgi:hypothetical protein